MSELKTPLRYEGRHVLDRDNSCPRNQDAAEIVRRCNAAKGLVEMLGLARTELFSWCGADSGSQPVLDAIDAALAAAKE